MSGDPALVLGLTQTERSKYGCIVTVCEQARGLLEAIHRVGTTLSALREIVDEIDAAEGDWKIVTICTPQSIFRDLQGLRQTDGRDTDPRSAEVQLLGKIGRNDLLQGRSLAPRVDNPQKLPKRGQRIPY